jgi:AcrR family transcriptional regulator
MGENTFAWSGSAEEACNLLAQGNLTHQEIADRVGISRTTLWAWRKNADFKARLDAVIEEIRAEVRRIGIADVIRRVSHLNDMSNRMRRVIEARADDPTMQGVPGGPTGLVVRTQKMIGTGEAATLVEEYAVDTGLLKELREHHKQAAQELGQWAERQQVTGADGGPLVVMKLGQSASLDDI